MSSEFKPTGRSSFSAKFLTMRKPQEFVIYPRKEGEHIMIQSDKSCGVFNCIDGKGILNMKSQYPSMLRTSGVMFDLPEEILTYCKASGYKSGDTIAGGVVTVL